MASPDGNANPVSWSEIGTQLWITACVLGGVLAAAVAWDVAGVSRALRKQPRRLHGFHAAVEPSLRLRALRLLHPSRSRLGRLVEVLAVAMGLAQLGLYAYGTYTLAPPGPVTAGATIATLIVAGFFALRYALYLALTEPGRRVRFVLTWVSLADLVSIVGCVLPVLRAVDTSMTLSYLRCVCVYASYTALDESLLPGVVCTRVQRQVARVVVAGLAFIVILACSVATVERAGDLWGMDQLVARPFDLWSALYFAVVTITTVGYGDVTPVTAVGRFLTVRRRASGYGEAAVVCAGMRTPTTRRFSPHSSFPPTCSPRCCLQASCSSPSSSAGSRTRCSPSVRATAPSPTRVAS